MQSKLFWDSLFKEGRVKTPEIVGTIKDGKINKVTDIPDNELLIKPNMGGWGQGIKLLSDVDLNKIGKKFYIIQRKIHQANPFHYRLVTTHNGILTCYKCMAKKNKIQSNSTQGGTCKEFQELPKKVIDDALRLHNLLPKYIVSCGWDIMLSESNVYYFLEGNIPSGTVLATDPDFYTEAPKVDNKIRDIISK